MKTFLKILAVLSLSGLAMADTTTARMGLIQISTSPADIWGIKYNNTLATIDTNAAVQASSNVFTSSNTFNQSIILPTISPATCMTTDANGKVIGQACGGGGGSSTLETIVGTVQISSPTKTMVFSGNTFRGSLAGSATAQIDLLPTTTYFIQNRASLQAGTTFYTSSGTVTNLNTTTLKFNDGTTQTSALNGGNFIQNQATLQSGATFYVSSGTANSFIASTATIANLVQILGTGATGSSIVFQAASSTFNVTAQGRVGIGTASPNNTLDVRGDMSVSTITVSSITVSNSFISKGSSVLQNPISINQVGFGPVASAINFTQIGNITGGSVSSLWYGGTGFNSPLVLRNTSFVDSTAFNSVYIDPYYGTTVLGSTNNAHAFAVGNTLGSGYSFSISTTGPAVFSSSVVDSSQSVNGQLNVTGTTYLSSTSVSMAVSNSTFSALSLNNTTPNLGTSTSIDFYNGPSGAVHDGQIISYRNSVGSGDMGFSTNNGLSGTLGENFHLYGGGNSISGAAVTGGGFLGMTSISYLTLQGTTPYAKGEYYYCSDCATVSTCVSTGTVVGSFSLITNKTSACQ